MGSESPLCFTFEVSVTTLPDEHVCLTGSIDELGNWDLNKGIILHPKSPTLKESCNVWSCDLLIGDKSSFNYCYYVCNIINVAGNASKNSFIVTKWEASPTQRTWQVLDDSQRHITLCDQFGVIGGAHCCSLGWLTVQTDLKLTLLPNFIHLHDDHIKLTSIKCVPFQMSHTNGSILQQESNLLWSKATCYILTEENYKASSQDEFGCIYEPDSILTFKFQVLNTSKIGFRLDFYGHHTSIENNLVTHMPNHIGYSYILPSFLKDSLGTATTYISNLDQNIAGEMKVKYCITRPLEGHPCSLEFSYQNQLLLQKEPLHIGHRGMGSSFTLPNSVMENTIASFCAAGQYGADFVEMDIHLTKDHVPIAYHDFTINIAMEQKQSQALLDNHTNMSIKNLSMKQLQYLKLFYYMKEQGHWMPITESTCESDQPFPTLEKCLQKVPEDIGFNVELKYPLECQDGTMENEDIFDANFFLDVILNIIFNYAGKRKIILSTFEPDLCCMLQLKQNKYPVFFLTQGINSRWINYKDTRCQSTTEAVNYAKAESLPGICAHAEEILKNTDLIEMCVRQHVSLIVWGSDIENTENMKYLMEQPITGLIYNRMDIYGPASVLKRV
ncbi:glycerophosphocholine phosphodiesterase GPCPD1-like [Argonauta hians]